MQPRVRLGALICPFCVVGLTVLGCHRTPTDATRDGSVSPVAVSAGPPIDPFLAMQDQMLGIVGDAARPSAPPSEPIRDAGPALASVALTVTGPTEAGDERIIAGMRPAFTTCARNAVMADASIAASPTLAITIAANGDIASTMLTDTTGLSKIEVDCLLRRANRTSFDAGPGRTLHVTIKQQSLPK